MFRILFYDQIDSLPADLHRRVSAFLSDYISEGTVALAPGSYRNADTWALAVDPNGRIIGFAVQRLFEDEGTSVVQVMGAYLAPELRGKLVAGTLLQGGIFVRAWLRAPWKKISWCARTRVPGVYRTAARFNRLYPVLDAPEKTRALFGSAARVARLVYGDHTTLEPDTFLMRNSYAAGSVFLPLRRTRETPVGDAFARPLNYHANEAIFLFCRLNRLNILRYVLTSILFRWINTLALFAYRIRTKRSHSPVPKRRSSIAALEPRPTYGALADEPVTMRSGRGAR